MTAVMSNSLAWLQCCIVSSNIMAADSEPCCNYMVISSHGCKQEHSYYWLRALNVVNKKQAT